MAGGTSRQFVVDVPAQGSVSLKLQVAFPNGFTMAHGLQVSEHSPHANWRSYPPPNNACALRVVNARLAPAKYKELLLEAAGGCTAN